MTGKDLKSRGSLIQFVGLGALVGGPAILGASLMGMVISVAVFSFCLFKGGSLYKQGKAMLKEEKEAKENDRIVLNVPPSR